MVSVTISEANRRDATATAVCPAGTLVLSGGARVLGTASERRLVGSRPIHGNPPTAWEASAEVAAPPFQLEVYAICAQLSGATFETPLPPDCQTPMHQTPLAQTPLGQTPLAQTPMQTPMGQTPIGCQTPLPPDCQTPMAQTPLGQTPMAQTPLGQTPLGQTPMQTPLGQTPMGCQTPLPDCQTPTYQTPLAQTPLGQTPMGQTPMQTPLGQTPMGCQTPLPPDCQTPMAQTQLGQTPMQTPIDGTPLECQTPLAQTPTDAQNNDVETNSERPAEAPSPAHVAAAAAERPTVAEDSPRPTVADASQPRPFLYGVTIASPSTARGGSFDLARQAGFTHAYVVPDWATLQPSRGRFAWQDGQANDLDNYLAAARASGMRLIVRLGHHPPAWAAASSTPSTVSPADMETLAAGVAARARGVATAYEILNEPNLVYEWGGRPDPAAYTKLLAAAYRGIKSADPSAVVVSAGLAPHNGGLGGNIEDVDFLRAMYAAGARGAFDALGIHPYGGNSSPDRDPSACGLCFRRAELYRQLMVEHGDADKQAWITEFGYLHTTATDLGQYNWLKLPPERQADYLTAAFQFGYARWPWLGAMVVFNLDFDTVGWTPPTMGAYWFALLNPDGSPRRAYVGLRDMPKPGSKT